MEVLVRKLSRQVVAQQRQVRLGFERSQHGVVFNSMRLRA